jgi:SAM-dependent methyltransferase
MGPEGDRTPVDWSIPKNTFSEQIKKPLRRLLYPIYLKMINPFLEKRYAPLSDLNCQVDQWYWGHRGIEYELLRLKLHRLYRIKGSSVLIAGCGTSRDIPTWIPYQPSSIIGVDYFNYKRAWVSVTKKYAHKTKLSFMQADITKLIHFDNGTFDIIGSDAVFEHLKDLPSVLNEFFRILKPNGVVYATFGPLWYSWGGDHISGYDDIASGYNHLLLEREAHKDYLDKAGEFSHSEHDGRTWITNDLFSYLRPNEYMNELNKAGFEKLFLGIILEPRAVQCLADNPTLRTKLLEKNNEFNLIVTGMIIIFKKPK